MQDIIRDTKEAVADVKEEQKHQKSKPKCKHTLKDIATSPVSQVPAPVYDQSYLITQYSLPRGLTRGSQTSGRDSYIGSPFLNTNRAH